MSSHQSISKPHRKKDSDPRKIKVYLFIYLFSTMRIGERMKQLYHYQYTPHTTIYSIAPLPLPKSMLLYLWSHFSSWTETPQVPNLQLANCKLHQSLQGLYSDPTCTARNIYYSLDYVISILQIYDSLCRSKLNTHCSS